MNITRFENKRIFSYLQKGEGTPLVFIHGFCGESSGWDDFVLLFPGRTILRIDLPGFGQSELIEHYSIPKLADVIHAVLEDLKISNFIFIGHSMGGYIGLEFAKQYGDLLKGLCLFHSHPYEDTAEKKRTRRQSINFIKRNGPIHYVKQLIPNLFASSYRDNNHLQLAKLVFRASKYSAESIITGLEAMMERTDNTSVLQTASFPFLFIIGKEDALVPEYQNDTARPDIASIHILKNVGHMGMLESSKKCERIIKDFTALVDLQNS